jgi:UDP-3-O-acyl N-acetylglucosamine deacetylase
MSAAPPQQTIAGRTSVTGFGYWTGEDVCIEFRPAPIDAGITFVRADIGPQVRVAARVEHRNEAPRRTNLCRGQAEVHMVEHVLAALAGLEIDNCEVWTNRPEMPGCDGSSGPFVDALFRAGLVRQDASAHYLRITDPVRVVEGESWIEARPSQADQLHIEYQLDYPRHSVIGRQVARITATPERFRRELASCRTFVLESEAEEMVRQGLGLRVTPRDLLVFNEAGPVDNRLRYPNECARHKALDVLGDLALVGCRVAGEITAHRSGHRLHAELTRKLLERFASVPLKASA